MIVKCNVSCFVIAAIGIAVMVVGRYFSSSGQQFYQTLNRSALTPPGWVFSVVWPVIYLLMFIATVYIWNNFERNRTFWAIIVLLVMNILVNVSWPYLFFNQQQIFLALLAAIVIELNLMALIPLIATQNVWVSLLLVPYALWTLFAIYLNYVTWTLN